MIAVVEGLAKTTITNEEVARFKAKPKRRFKLTFANSPQLGIRLSEYIAAGDWRLLFLHRDRVAALTADAIQKVAATRLASSNRTLGVFYPTKAPERAPQETAAELADAKKGFLSGFERNLSNDPTVMNLLHDGLYLGRTHDGLLDQAQRRHHRPHARPGQRRHQASHQARLAREDHRRRQEEDVIGAHAAERHGVCRALVTEARHSAIVGESVGHIACRH